MSSRRKKIATGGDGSLANNPFGRIDVTGLPKGQIRETATESGLSQTKQKPKGRVEIRREKSGRGGKTVTTLREFPTHIPLSTLEAITFDLKKICACGGTLKGRVIELQGDVRDRVFVELTGRGYQPVRAGG